MMQETSPIFHASADSRWDKLAWVLLLAIPLLVWALWPFPEVLRKNSTESYVLHFSVSTLIRFYAVFYGLYVLPGLILFFWVARRWAYNPFFSPTRFLLAFGWGIMAHVSAIFIQKYLHLAYQPLTVLSCLFASYLILAFLFRPLKFLLIEQKPDEKFRWIAWGVLLLALALGMEMTLRGRASSVSLMGDAYPHLINILGTLADGPLPDGLPFYSTFILNIHPMAYHALAANLFTLMPGIDHIDLLRYFSAMLLPGFVVVFFAFFSFLARCRSIGAVVTLALLFVSGGGWSLQVPIVYFPWYWALAWCVTAVLFFLILRSEFESKALYFWAGVLFGAGVLIHPFMAFRVGAILTFFFFFELIRRAALRDRLPPLFLCGVSFILGSALPLGIWLLPMVLRHGWEETYSYDYIVEHFKSVAPRGVGYIQKIRESSYGLADLYYWSKGNAGWFALIFSPVGVAVAFWKYRKTTSMFLLAWVSAMGSAAVLGYLLNPYRYFEYFFLGLMALAAYGLGGVYHGLGGRWRVFLLLGALAVAVAGIRIDFFPKYRQTLHYYGQTQWKEEFLQRSRNMAGRYINSKRQGRLDRELGGYTGYLWSRQKKVWEIYMSHPKGNK